MRIPEGFWELSADAETFANLRNDKETHFLLVLARMVDALKFGVRAMQSVQESKAPAADRQRVGVLLHMSATLNEIVDFRKKYGDTWGSLTAFDTAYSALNRVLTDPDLAAAMGKLRNKAAFHFDPEIAGQVLRQLPAQDVVFATGQGTNRFEMGYDLADIVALAFALDVVDDLGSLPEKVSRLLAATGTMARAFVLAADGIILDRLAQRGWRFASAPPVHD